MSRRPRRRADARAELRLQAAQDLQGLVVVPPGQAGQDRVTEELREHDLAEGDLVGTVLSAGGRAALPGAQHLAGRDGAEVRENRLVEGLRRPAGRRGALVGPSGVGKTTVTTLLLRFLDPVAGRVTLAGRDLREYRQEDVRRAIGVAGQDAYLFSTSIRENLRMSRRESLPDVVNRSINQTLSRTVLTSGLTFLTVLSLLIFGGPVLRGFSFALVVGILIGTYSSIAVAAPMLVAWQEWRAKGGKPVVLPAAKRSKV